MPAIHRPALGNHEIVVQVVIAAVVERVAVAGAVVDTEYDN